MCVRPLRVLEQKVCRTRDHDADFATRHILTDTTLAAWEAAQ